jgi:tRNA pseudouridine38-40 synthase
MALFRVTLAYDGTEFEGWQVQIRGGKARRTVQGALETALSTLNGGAPVRVSGAGRTDAGVHAEGQVASFEFGRDMAPGELGRALNGLLPRDVRVLGCAHPPADFHARKSALSKVYRYVLDTGREQLPTRRRYAGYVPMRLDEDAVRAGAALVLGRRDFKSLATAGGNVKTTVRTLMRSDALFEGLTLVYWVEADGFLRQMVRNLVGGLLACGKGLWTPADLERALLARDRRAWPGPVDARGLSLVEVRYPPTSQC